MASTSQVGPKNIVLDDLTVHNIKQLQKINTAVFPIHYADKFYKDGLESSIHFSKLAYFNDIVVGGVCVRLEDSSSEEIGRCTQPPKPEDVQKAQLKRVYIMTLGVLTAYRRYGVGRKLLEWVKDLAKEQYGINGIYLHVQTNNFVAKEFYEKQGFTTRGDIHKQYYTRIEPADAYLLGFDIEPRTKSENLEQTISASEKANVGNEPQSSKNTSPVNSNKASTSNTGSNSQQKPKQKNKSRGKRKK